MPTVQVVRGWTREICYSHAVTKVPPAAAVTPRKWSKKKIAVLFDNGVYSVISGHNGDREAIGERWNGPGNGIGFPNSRGFPIWHLVPPFLEIPILRGLLEELARNPKHGDRDAILRELEARSPTPR